MIADGDSSNIVKAHDHHRDVIREQLVVKLIGKYRECGDATKVLSQMAYQPEPKWQLAGTANLNHSLVLHNIEFRLDRATAVAW
jgi:hypothetical protein